MDPAIRRRMNCYQSDVENLGHVQSPVEGQSTLTKADISVFHETPPTGLSVEDKTARLSAEPSEYQRGLQKGRDEERELSQQTIAVMQIAVNKLQAEIQSVQDSVEQSHLSAIRNMLSQAFPYIIKRDVNVQLSTVIKANASDALKGQVVITAHPKDIESCQLMCGEKIEDFVFVKDNTRAPENMSVKWEGGGAEIKAADAARAILDVLDTSLGGDFN